MTGALMALGGFGWWIAGLVLLVLEIVIPGVYLLFPGIAAFVVGTNVLIVGGTGWFGWEQQVIAFLAVSAAAVLVGRRWYGAPRGGGQALTGGRADRLVGSTALLSDAIVTGRGKVAIDDGWWMAEGPDMPAGTRVRITGARGAVLTVERAGP